MTNLTRDVGRGLQQGIRDAHGFGFGPFTVFYGEIPIGRVLGFGISFWRFGASLQFVLENK